MTNMPGVSKFRIEWLCKASQKMQKLLHYKVCWSKQLCAYCGGRLIDYAREMCAPGVAVTPFGLEYSGQW